MEFTSKLPQQPTSIFAVMSALAREHNAINLSQGFPNYNPEPKLLALARKYFNEGYNQYAPMPGVPVLNREIARKINNYYKREADPSTEITITAGATQALFTAIAAIVKPNDEAIIIEPAYDSYKPAIEIMGGVCVSYHLKSPEFVIDWDAFKSLITDKTKLVIINSPHNPTGSILSKDDIHKLNEILEPTNIVLISDEVYEHLIFDDLQHNSILAHKELYQRTMVIYSFGKTFHCTGWKLGYVVAPPWLTTEFRKIHQFNVFSVNRPLQHALAEYMSEGDVFSELSSFYQAKRDFFIKQLEKSRFKVMPCHGTYFLTADYSDISDLPDKEFAIWLTVEKGIACIPVSSFNSDGTDESLVRFCFAKTEDVLREAGECLSLI